MNTIQMFFRTPKTKSKDEVVAKIHAYLAALLQNGQIIGDHTPMARVTRGYVVTLSVPDGKSLADRFANKWVRKTLRELAALGIQRPAVKNLGHDPESLPPCTCRKRPFLILFTTFLHAEPPLRCGACFGPIPLYTVPVTNDAGNHQSVLWWQETYQAMDWLFIGTGPGEKFAHGQLSRHDSPLSRDGRDLARALEKKMRLPIYYFLSKHFGRSVESERQRRCPSCGRSWLRTERLHRVFDFQCRRCRLLSNVAFDVRI